MRLLANENFPVPSIKILRARGLEVRSIREEMAASDRVVLHLAQTENMIILTFDRD